MSTTAVVVAAGSGERLGDDRPTAFVPLHGKPMLTYALLAIDAATSVENIVVVVGAGHVGEAEEIAAGLTGKPLTIVTGGATRTASVQEGVAVTTTEQVAIH